MGKKDKLARLRAARSGTNFEDFSEEDNTDIYEEVDELQYRKHKRDQVLNDDFIVDENGEGYAETGADDWDQQQEYYSSEEEVDQETGEKRKKKKVKKIKESNSSSKGIDSFFKQPKLNEKKKSVAVDPSLLDDILNDFTNKATNSLKNKPLSSTKKRKDPFSSLKSDKIKSSTPSNSFVKPLNFNKSYEFDDDLKQTPIKKPKLESDDDFYTAMDFDDSSISNIDTPSSPIKSKNPTSANLNILEHLDKVKEEPGLDKMAEKCDGDTGNKDNNDGDESDDEIVVSHRNRKTVDVDRSINLSASKSKPAEIDQKQIDSSPLKDSKSIPLSSSPSKFSNFTPNSKGEDEIVIKTEDGSENVHIYWLDYIELDNSLLLFGKIKCNDGKLVSGMVKVNNINRELYFLPRKHRKVVDDNDDDKNEGQEDEDDKLEKDDNPCTAMDVYDEIIPLLMDKFGLDSIKAKPQTMKYAFELHNVPKSAEYLKVLLPYQTPKNSNIIIPSALDGETFSHVFGTNASIFESFVLQRKVMGPCWLSIKNCNFKELQNVSHCNVEISISTPNDITVLNNNEPAPNLNVLSINVQSFMNIKSSKQEVGSVSIAFYKNLPQDQPISENLEPNDMVTLVRPIAGTITLPPRLSQLASKKNISIRAFNNEKTLLNCLSSMIKKCDPDVFVGHKLEMVTLDIIIHRMHDLNVSTWSNIGRRSRKRFPDKFSRTTGRNNLFMIRELCAGRLLCDISNEMGQSLTMKCQSWELPEMYEVVCRKKYTPMEVNLANPALTEDASRLLAAINENNMAVKMISETAFAMQILSISKQLTNLAGNAWSHTLGGTRAGRNEYILLHEFIREGYIVPDKETRAQKMINAQQNNRGDEIDGDNGGGGDDENNVTSNKKSKFQGGLVFEPEKGLHKNYILVMDFNSLYPSIIQEFNICFTTVERSNLNGNELPKVPNSNSVQGVLPRLLQQLVSRRGEVKKLMKDPKISLIEKGQYDIKQMALKLTANSMYGCLGYVNSRFYAKPLAMLVTNRGREILMDTRQLAESLGLRVVYGDTDSVMIDTGSESYEEAIKIGNDFKLKVNERYTLLEIDIDNVFKRLLLHSKKKYAALNVTINPKGEEITNLEVKGLDMKRREYCPLSKEISTYILNKILESVDPHEALNEIYTYLEDISRKLNDNEIPMIKLKINTRLSKDPNKYPGGKNMPAVQVALRLQKQGKIIKAGNVITFVITSDELNKDLSVAERARSITEILGNKEIEYKPDTMYYLEKQLFAPIERLLGRVEGYDVVRLATSLSLDSKRYESRARFLQKNNELEPLESIVPDKERFRDSKDLKINCPSCDQVIKFGGLQSSNDYQITFSGIKCKKCDHLLSTLSFSAQLEYFVRHEVANYYQGWLICDDCGIKTKQVSVYGRRCIGAQGKAHGCKGVMRYIYSDRMLYNQLLYLKSLFDVEKAKKHELKPLYEASDESKPEIMNQAEMLALSEQNRNLFEIFANVVDKYLENNGRRYVDMGSIFGFMAGFQKT